MNSVIIFILFVVAAILVLVGIAIAWVLWHWMADAWEERKFYKEQRIQDNAKSNWPHDPN